MDRYMSYISRSALKILLIVLEDFSEVILEFASKESDEYMEGFYRGKAAGYRLAVEFLKEELFNGEEEDA